MKKTREKAASRERWRIPITLTPLAMLFP
jgi:hypothetical protein